MATYSLPCVDSAGGKDHQSLMGLSDGSMDSKNECLHKESGEWTHRVSSGSKDYTENYSVAF